MKRTLAIVFAGLAAAVVFAGLVHAVLVGGPRPVAETAATSVTSIPARPIQPGVGGKNMTLRSVGAVAAGFVAVAVGSTLVDVVLHATSVYPPWGQPIGNGLSLLATAYRVAITIGGGYLTARLAPNRPLASAVARGIVGVVVAN